ncbi:hypothetical protein ACFQY8_02150 [Alloscardovia venturai]|uniref:DUF8020 domain-containing protein n=1 Tax=Alloscardovia venturai TaxID=1769421 RepID=A0ABW2Y4A1_9BIFI
MKSLNRLALLTLSALIVLAVGVTSIPHAVAAEARSEVTYTIEKTDAGALMTLQNGTFSIQDNGTANIINTQGTVVATLQTSYEGKSITYKKINSSQLEALPKQNNMLRFKRYSTNKSNKGKYVRCISGNTLGGAAIGGAIGAFGGPGGAAAGALTGLIGGLIWNPI